MRIGNHALNGKVVLAPMAGVTDRPFRLLCREHGAALAASEMVHASPALRDSRKSRLRADHRGEPSPRVVQIAGPDPAMLAEAAQYNAANGAEIIDINMGCPAKKVCNRQAGSALLADEALVASILDAVVAAVDIPVTLKIRTGPTADNRNGVRIARMAERAGIAALAVHGRTREALYRGEAEYDTIRAIRQATSLPLFANGDIDTPEKADRVLDHTGADGVMIGRAAQGRPWIFREIQHFLETGRHLPAPDATTVRTLMLDHLRALHAFYGDHQGVRIARKHIGWYLAGRPDGEAARRALVAITDPQEQLARTAAYFDRTPAAA
ncbi:tRNA dihydrouridine synthase DusB [Aquisalimonas sp. APHAB1-3]|uniref:tRNA dihydrouridine synthase DusB n=1 Tax=unclassified Aquisalimonas TaxID=2644645 RepID=UPI0025BD27A0|nr:tRNA dihydrouridine synthase DusB [Aquisalimonas sp.]